MKGPVFCQVTRPLSGLKKSFFEVKFLLFSSKLVKCTNFFDFQQSVLRCTAIPLSFCSEVKDTNISIFDFKVVTWLILSEEMPKTAFPRVKMFIL